MDRDFSQSYGIIYDNFIKSDVASSFPRSRTGLARFLGHGHDGKVRAWEKGQWPSAYDCWVIHKKMGFCLEWLLTGEGEMLVTDSAPTVTSQQPAVQSDEVTRLLAELAEERRLNRQLVTRLLVDGAGDKDDSKNTVGKAAEGQ